MGQGAIPVIKDAMPWETVRAKLKKNWTLKQVPSFEVWIAVTCYDPAATDGGEAFQSMMHWALTAGDLPSRAPIVKERHYRAPKERIDNLVSFKHESHAVTGKGRQRYEDNSLGPKGGSAPVYTSALATRSKVPGGGVNSMSDVKRGFDVPGWAEKGSKGNRFVTPGGNPHGKLWWWESAGMAVSQETPQGDNCSGKNSARQFNGEGEAGGEGSKGKGKSDAEEGCTQNQGNVNMANRLSAYYGLYYYPECLEPDNNWYHDVEFGMKVRMRMPNPAYRSIEKTYPVKLRVYEPVNEPYTKKDKYVGGPLGFIFPQLKPPDTSHGLCWDYIARYYEGKRNEDIQTKGKTQKKEAATEEGIATILQPWAGLRGGGTTEVLVPKATIYWAENEKSTVWAKKLTLIKQFLDEKGWGGRMHKRGEEQTIKVNNTEELIYGLSFGWCMPSALWLYPHYHTKEPGDCKPGTPKQASQYQPWPDWNYNGAQEDFSFFPFEPTRPFITMLQKAPKSDLPNKQLYALNKAWKPVDGAHHARPLKADGSDDYLGELLAQMQGKTTTTKKKAPATSKVVAKETTPAPTAVAPDDRQDQARAEGDDNVNTADAEGGSANPKNDKDRSIGDIHADLVTDLDDETDPALSVQDQRPDGDLDLDGATSLEAKAALARGTIERPPLPPGFARRREDIGGNHHFFSTAHSPWPVKDLYKSAEHNILVDDPMNKEEIEEYTRNYGNVSNLLLRSNTHAKIKIIENTEPEVLRIGKERILDMPLDSYTNSKLTDKQRKLFRDHMRRILSIYFDQSGHLGRGQTISVKDKQLGMREGVFACKGKQKEAPQIKYGIKQAAGCTQIFAPVFKKLPDDGSAFVSKRSEHLYRGEPGDDTASLFEIDDAVIDAVEAPMTVLEWVQTPWHYEYLPYQPMSSVFKDGEGYCNGCTRCSRPFYEYQFLYSHYRLAQQNTSHWVHQYWRMGAEASWDFNKAPVPFHEPALWSKKEVRSASAQNEVEPEAVEAARAEITPSKFDGTGYHNWPTHRFLLGYDANEQRCGTYKDTKWIATPKNKACGPLQQEWLRRVERQDKLKAIFNAHRQGKPFTFRKYINHAYDPQIGQYPTLTQGVVRTRNAKVVYGMTDYKLMRSIKYGNVCRDCMATLDTAPHQYHRTGRVIAGERTHVKGLGNRDFDTWWLDMVGTKLEDGSVFDPWFIYVQTPGLLKPKEQDGTYTQGGHKHHTYDELVKGGMRRDEEKRKAIVDALAKMGKKYAYRLVFPKHGDMSDKAYFGEQGYLQKAIDMHLRAVEQKAAKYCMVQSNGVNITKIKTPEVYIQKYWDENPTEWKAKDAERMRDASKILDKIIKWLDESYRGEGVTASTKPLVLQPNEINVGYVYNRALRDALHDTHYLMSHMSAYAREAGVPTFDPDMTRNETRGDTLEIRQMVLPSVRKNQMRLEVGKDGKGKIDPKREPWEKIDGRRVIRTFHQGNSDWEGDDFVKQYGHKNATDQAKAVAAKEQTRTLTQSRLFITYSLHRRVFSELEARAVLEKMADACRCLFGNDKELCRLILFGRKLESQGGGDTVSTKRYVPITKPKKADKVFYGNEQGNSYMHDKYQTHVESVSVDVGVEIGPTYHHPHFHALLTINHWSYIQLDTFRMKATLEKMFKGTHADHGSKFKLIDGKGLPFYTDNENAYVDIRVYPSDNWAEVVAAYVRKGADSQSIMALKARTGQGPNIGQPFSPPED